jgi:hypothetical protein
MKNKNHINWCSKHQIVHQERKHKSCRYPNLINKLSKNKQILDDFIGYCVLHPEQRFWQALRNWAKVRYVYVSNDTVNYCPKIIDTYYFEGKDK